jgi:hypothetical protein
VPIESDRMGEPLEIEVSVELNLMTIQHSYHIQCVRRLQSEAYNAPRKRAEHVILGLALQWCNFQCSSPSEDALIARVNSKMDSSPRVCYIRDSVHPAPSGKVGTCDPKMHSSCGCNIQQ